MDNNDITLITPQSIGVKFNNHNNVTLMQNMITSL